MSTTIACKTCGTPGLHFDKTPEGGYRLHDASDTQHICPVAVNLAPKPEPTIKELATALIKVLEQFT